VVRGVNLHSIVIGVIENTAVAIGSDTICYVWLDGLCDSFDATKISATGTTTDPTVTAITGLGGQLLKVVFAGITLNPATATVTFAAGAFTRTGQINDADTVSLSTDRGKRFMPVRSLYSKRGLADQFKTGIEVAVARTYPALVPSVATATKWSSSDEDTTILGLSPAPITVYNPMTPSIANTAISQEHRGRSANHATMDRVYAVTPLVCGEIIDIESNDRLTFTAPYADIADAAYLYFPYLYNVTKDQWLLSSHGTLAGGGSGLVHDTAPTAPDVVMGVSDLYSIFSAPPVDWDEDDVCVAVSDHPDNDSATAVKQWPTVTSNPCIRHTTGVYPALKVNGGANLVFTGMQIVSVGGWRVIDGTPVLSVAPAAFETVSYSAHYGFSVSWVYDAGRVADIIAAFEALSPIRIKLAPFAGNQALLDGGGYSIPDASLYTETIATITPTVTVNQTTDEYGAVTLYVNVFGSAAGTHPMHSIGWLAAFIDDSETDLDPSLIEYISLTTTYWCFANYDYPLHQHTLRDVDGQAPGRLWASEPALALMP
jgi:hypothetical protein